MQELKNHIERLFASNNLSKDLLPKFYEFIATEWYNEFYNHPMNAEIILKNRVASYNISFPNAKVGESYENVINVPDTEIIDWWIEGHEQTGLLVEILSPTKESRIEDEHKDVNCGQLENKYVSKSLRIYGTPTSSGEFNIVAKFKFKKQNEVVIVVDRLIKFAINPNPRSLWKDIPTDENIKFYKKDKATDYVTVLTNANGPQKDIVAASVRGRSHAHEGKARDDDFNVFHDYTTGWYILAVADGAGSAKYSRKGSDVACKKALEHCKEALKKPTDLELAISNLKNAELGTSNKEISDLIYKIIGGAAHKAHRAIAETATSNEDQLRDYSTTLLLAICKKFDFGWFVASFWVGDGAMCIYDKNRQYFKLLGTPDGGEYAGQTRFLTMKEIFTPESIMSRLKYSIEEDFTALLLMTDGVSDPFFETDANLNKIEKWNALWENILSEVNLINDNSDSQYQLLKWLDFWSPGNHDDRTIAILY